MKQKISCLLVVVMLLTMLPATTLLPAFAADGTVEDGFLTNLLGGDCINTEGV